MVEEIAHIIPTHERPSVCQRLVDSINRQWEDSHIYVCDDSMQPAKYKGAKNVKAPGYDIGLSAKRNLLVQRTDEPYIFLWDDDYVAYNETSLEMFYYTLKALDGVGIVAGEWMFRSGQRTQWFCGNLIPQGATMKLRSLSRQPQAVETEIGEVRYHTPMVVANWFLAAREALETVPWDEQLKLNEHLEFFCRLSAVRNETKLDKEWRKRYKKLARGQKLKEAKEDDKIAVYALTTFLNPNILPEDQEKVHQGEWVEMERKDAEELSEKGYIAHLEDIADTRPFNLPKNGGKELGVAMIPDTTCIHLRSSSRSKKYNEKRYRWEDFMPIQKAKLGVRERDLSQWGKYPYGGPDFENPKESVLQESEPESW